MIHSFHLEELKRPFINQRLELHIFHPLIYDYHSDDHLNEKLQLIDIHNHLSNFML